MGAGEVPEMLPIFLVVADGNIFFVFVLGVNNLIAVVVVDEVGRRCKGGGSRVVLANTVRQLVSAKAKTRGNLI